MGSVVGALPCSMAKGVAVGMAGRSHSKYIYLYIWSAAEGGPHPVRLWVALLCKRVCGLGGTSSDEILLGRGSLRAICSWGGDPTGAGQPLYFYYYVSPRRPSVAPHSVVRPTRQRRHRMIIPSGVNRQTWIMRYDSTHCLIILNII